MKVKGACHCGAIRFEAEIDPAKVTVCHCTDCQVLSGGPFRVIVPTEEGSFRLLGGAPKVYIKTAESGRRRQQAFCPDCGTPIYAAPEGEGTEHAMVRIGSLEGGAALAPQRGVWGRSAVPWLDGLGKVPAADTV